MNSISICLIVKDELENLKQLLPSLKEIGDEIIVVDTGSIDGTYEYLMNLDFINLFKFQWKNDFSKARNFSIEKTTKDFVLWLDADDRIINPEKFIDLKKKIDKNSVYFIKIKNSSDDTFFYQLRLFPNFQDIKFYGKIHEQINFNHKKFNIKYIEEPIIVHTGYEDRETLIKKHKRNIKILNSIENKTDYEKLQLAESLKIIGDYNNALILFKELINSGEIKNENLELFCYIHFEIFRIEKMMNIDNPDKWLFKVEEYGKYFPLILYYIGREFFKKMEFLKARDYFKKFLEFHKNFIYLNPVPEKIEDSCLYFLANCEIELGNLIEAKKIVNFLLEKDPVNKAYMELKIKVERLKR